LKDDGSRRLEFGEMMNKQLNGRCMKINGDGYLRIGNYKQDEEDVGSFVSLYINGDILVGDRYRLDPKGGLRESGTWYNADRTTGKYNSSEQ